MYALGYTTDLSNARPIYGIVGLKYNTCIFYNALHTLYIIYIIYIYTGICICIYVYIYIYMYTGIHIQLIIVGYSVTLVSVGLTQYTVIRSFEENQRLTLGFSVHVRRRRCTIEPVSM